MDSIAWLLKGDGRGYSLTSESAKVRNRKSDCRSDGGSSGCVACIVHELSASCCGIWVVHELSVSACVPCVVHRLSVSCCGVWVAHGLRVNQGVACVVHGWIVSCCGIWIVHGLSVDLRQVGLYVRYRLRGNHQEVSLWLLRQQSLLLLLMCLITYSWWSVWDSWKIQTNSAWIVQDRRNKCIFAEPVPKYMGFNNRTIWNGKVKIWLT